MQVTFLVTISFTNIWSKFPLGLQICIPTQIYLLHRKVGDTFHTGNNFRKRCGVKSTTTAISLFLVYICSVSNICVMSTWSECQPFFASILWYYYDKKGYIISKKVSLYDQQISFVLVVAFKGSIAIPKMVYPLETRSGLSLSNKAYLVLIHGWARPSFAFQNLVSPHIIHSEILKKGWKRAKLVFPWNWVRKMHFIVTRTISANGTFFGFFRVLYCMPSPQMQSGG